METLEALEKAIGLEYLSSFKKDSITLSDYRNDDTSLEPEVNDIVSIDTSSFQDSQSI